MVGDTERGWRWWLCERIDAVGTLGIAHPKTSTLQNGVRHVIQSSYCLMC